MMNQKALKQNLIRIAGYVLGFALFYEPFTLFQKLAGKFIAEPGFTSIHVPCARIPLAKLLTGDLLQCGPISLFFLALLALSCFIWGPVFCGRLCPAGALPEYFSKLIPDRFKIDWVRFLPVVPIRCGFGIGFLFSAFLGFALPCPYCNYFTFDILLTFLRTGQLLTSALSLLVTFVIWFVIFGLFTQGGRGYCNFLCPVGTFNSFLHFLGSKVPGTCKMQIDGKRCIGCGSCARVCPMRAASVQDKKAQISIHHCIICGQCAQACPQGAIRYGSHGGPKNG